MTIHVSGASVTDGLRHSIQQDLEAIIRRYLEADITADVTVSKNSPHQFKVDIHIRGGYHCDVHANAVGDEVHQTAHHAMEKLETQLRRYKTRLRERHRQDPHVVEKVQKYVLQTSEAEEVPADTPMVIAEMSTDILTLSVADAVMHMDLSPHPVIVFRNAAHNQLNVLFKREDGHIGWIDPSLKVN